MKKIFTVFIIYFLFHNLSLAEDRNFQSIGKVGGELYLLDYNSIKSGEGDEIKYIQLISFEKKQNTSDGKKYQSVQMYMKGKCNKNMNKPYILQFYDVQMNDGNTMKGNIVRTSKFGGDWNIPKEGTAYDVVLKEACKAWSLKN